MVAQATWAIIDEGQAEHQQALSTSQVDRAAKSLLIAEALWTVANGLLRLIACLLQLQMFDRGFVLGLRAEKVMILLSYLHTLASVLQTRLICRPFAAHWDNHILGLCGDQVASFITLEAAGLLLDLAILSLPIRPIFSLHIQRYRKWQIIIVIDAGAVLLIITALRMRTLYQAVSPDFTYSQSYLSLLSTLAVMLGVSLCSLPAVYGCIRRARNARNVLEVDEYVYGAPVGQPERRYLTETIRSSESTALSRSHSPGNNGLPPRLEITFQPGLYTNVQQVYNLPDYSQVSLREGSLLEAHLRPETAREVV